MYLSKYCCTQMNTMYNEMWRRMVSVESLIKELGRLSNMTRQEVIDELHSLVPPDHKDSLDDLQESEY